MTLSFATVPADPLAKAARDAKGWLFEAAAPLWSSNGRTQSGLFAERMTLCAEPDSSYFRTFVQARHVYSFATLGKLGWQGPWRELVGDTIGVILHRARRPDGYYCHRLDVDARPLDRRADLYDQAFVLLALATAGAALDCSDWFDDAEALVDLLGRQWSHPLGGFQEGELADPSVRRQNPHMHLLESFLALYEASGRTSFLDSAQAIARLAADKFIDPASGALLEYFTDDLRPAAGLDGRRAEPGHCFEWAWLFERFAAAGWSEGTCLSDRLSSFARGRGLNPNLGVAVNEVLTDGKVHDANARLWPQTERLKAAVIRYIRLGEEFEVNEVLAAYRGLIQYLNVPVAGLWRDKLKADGGWIDEMAPGSSLYHITCAFEQLERIN